MLTKRALNELLQSLQSDLKANGFPLDAMILYGSYAKGNIHKYSDVDIALWGSNFSGEGLLDFEKIQPVLRNYRKVHAKFYPPDADENNFDPFIEEIKKTGIRIL